MDVESKKYGSALVSMSVTLLLAGCTATTNTKPQKSTQTATTPKSTKYYSNQEKTKMTYCVGLSDTALFISNQKLNGRPKDQLTAYYSRIANAKTQVALVDKVYNATFSNAWDYSIDFFEECAQQMAGVTKPRNNFATYCIQNSFIATVAYSYKQYGSPKIDAYKRFESFKSNVPFEVIDRVYSGNETTRSKVVLNEWDHCMDRISG